MVFSCYFHCLLEAVMLILFVVISLRAPPTPWGDVSQALIYHQVSMLPRHTVKPRVKNPRGF